MAHTIEATVHERGNGLPDVGDFVAGNDGEVYRVLKFRGPIQTGRAPGAGNWIRAEVELADWSDVNDDSEPTCSARIESDDAEDGH